MTTFPTPAAVAPDHALATHHPGAFATDVLDVAAEQRWTRWKLEGARLEAIRAGRMRKLFAAVGLASIVWLLLNL